MRVTTGKWAFALALSLLAAPVWAASLLIRDATLVDGTGAPARRADVRVVGDKVVAIGRLTRTTGETVIDAQGLALAPGFIDTHSHHNDGLETHPDALAAVSQGITTIIVGQDGGSESPLADYFRKMEATPAALNIASYSGHNSLRDKVLGDDYKRRATPAEVAKMERLLDADMQAGALGLSTGLEYDPGIYSDKSEVVALARVAARHGGRYISHMRSEDREVWAALDEIIAVGREANIPVQVSHAKLAMTDWWGQADRFLGVLDKARAEGIDATLDVYPYAYWHSTLTVMWPKRDFDDRQTAEFVLEHLAPADGLLLAKFTPDPTLVGKTVAEVARRRGLDAPATAMALIHEAEAAKGSVNVIATSMDERDIARFIAWPQANISSDGMLSNLHPRGAGAFTRVLRVYVRERKLLTLEQAVHKMTGLSARHMGISQRGEIRPGAYADLVLFDPATVADRATTSDPSALSAGIARVWVNGNLVYRDGKSTGAHPGRVLRRESRH
ncbi:MAG: D-aminoacylase [Proteobacteria bacterium]|nr:D-aminoacylase [Pseudomonadota bacterium]